MDLTQWYEDQWQQAVDYKEELIEILENSKFGGREYTPYEIYMKALYEYFRDDLDTEMIQGSDALSGRALRIPGGCGQTGAPHLGPL